MNDYIYMKPNNLLELEHEMQNVEQNCINTTEIGKELKILLQGCERLMIKSDEYPEITVNETAHIELQP